MAISPDVSGIKAFSGMLEMKIERRYLDQTKSAKPGIRSGFVEEQHGPRGPDPGKTTAQRHIFRLNTALRWYTATLDESAVLRVHGGGGADGRRSVGLEARDRFGGTIRGTAKNWLRRKVTVGTPAR